MLILCFPHLSATAQTLFAHSSSNQRKIWLFRKWWNFHISDFFQNVGLFRLRAVSRSVALSVHHISLTWAFPIFERPLVWQGLMTCQSQLCTLVCLTSTLFNLFITLFITLFIWGLGRGGGGILNTAVFCIVLALCVSVSSGVCISVWSLVAIHGWR